MHILTPINIIELETNQRFFLLVLYHAFDASNRIRSTWQIQLEKSPT